ncbi:hypothetical protein C8J56DRAFT_896418 [Mycena floridula]|nr:hypothetical protein C8J56DRAFT_896418 [Mycena floridula]
MAFNRHCMQLAALVNLHSNQTNQLIINSRDYVMSTNDICNTPYLAFSTAFFKPPWQRMSHLSNETAMKRRRNTTPFPALPTVRAGYKVLAVVRQMLGVVCVLALIGRGGSSMGIPGGCGWQMTRGPWEADAADGVWPWRTKHIADEGIYCYKSSHITMLMSPTHLDVFEASKDRYLLSESPSRPDSPPRRRMRHHCVRRSAPVRLLLLDDRLSGLGRLTSLYHADNPPSHPAARDEYSVGDANVSQYELFWIRDGHDCHVFTNICKYNSWETRKFPHSRVRVLVSHEWLRVRIWV